MEVEDRDVGSMGRLRRCERGFEDPVACEGGAGDEVEEVVAVGAVAGRREDR